MSSRVLRWVKWLIWKSLMQDSIYITQWKGTIAAENMSVVARYWVYEEAITIKQQEGDFGGDETVLCPNYDMVMQNIHILKLIQL